MKVSKTTSRKAVSKAIANQDVETQTTSMLAQEQIQNAIRLKAYELYVQRGCQSGNDRQDWIAAEQIILKQAGL